MALLVLSVVTVATPTPSSGESRPVNVEISVSPEQPAAGDDVTVNVFAIGCPPQPFEVEVYLVTTDGSTRSAAVMGRSESRVTLLWGARAQVVLPAALDGWYGVRVQCGTFRPAKLPMANTTFAVGTAGTKSSTATPDTVDVGGTFTYLGNGCLGDVVDYDVTQTAGRQTAFTSEGTFPVDDNGDWGGEITLPAKIVAGSAEVRARCSVVNQYGETVYVYYVVLGGITVVNP